MEKKLRFWSEEMVAAMTLMRCLSSTCSSLVSIPGRRGVHRLMKASLPPMHTTMLRPDHVWSAGVAAGAEEEEEEEPPTALGAPDTTAEAAALSSVMISSCAFQLWTMSARTASLVGAAGAGGAGGCGGAGCGAARLQLAPAASCCARMRSCFSLSRFLRVFSRDLMYDTASPTTVALSTCKIKLMTV